MNDKPREYRERKKTTRRDIVIDDDIAVVVVCHCVVVECACFRRGTKRVKYTRRYVLLYKERERERVQWRYYIHFGLYKPRI